MAGIDRLLYDRQKRCIYGRAWKTAMYLPLGSMPQHNTKKSSPPISPVVYLVGVLGFDTSQPPRLATNVVLMLIFVDVGESRLRAKYDTTRLLSIRFYHEYA